MKTLADCQQINKEDEMNYAKAYEELMKGKKVRRKEWEPTMHLCLVKDVVKSFRGEYVSFYTMPNIITSDGWLVVGDDKKISFTEALEELKNKKCVTREEYGDGYLFIDKDQLAICRPVEFEFMPTWKCFNALDWEIIK